MSAIAWMAAQPKLRPWQTKSTETLGKTARSRQMRVDGIVALAKIIGRVDRSALAKHMMLTDRTYANRLLHEAAKRPGMRLERVNTAGGQDYQSRLVAVWIGLPCSD